MFANLVKMGPFGADYFVGCPKNGVSYFQKKTFRVYGGCNPAVGCPKNGVSYFQKTAFRVFGGWWGASILNGIELRHPFRIQVPHNFVLLRQLERPSHVVLRLQLLRPGQIGF